MFFSILEHARINLINLVSKMFNISDYTFNDVRRKQCQPAMKEFEKTLASEKK